MGALSGLGFLLIGGVPRGPVAYRLTPRDTFAMRRIDGTLTGEVKVLLEAWIAERQMRIRAVSELVVPLCHAGREGCPGEPV